MRLRLILWTALVCVMTAGLAAAAGKDDIAVALNRPIIGPHRTLAEIQRYAEPRIPELPAIRDAKQWQQYADGQRRQILDRVVYRGAAAGWRDAAGRVEWLGTIAGGPGYRIRKLRYEAVPGLWVPALLYEPDKLTGKVPAVLNVNGHDPNGKAADYKQLRCINQAKRGLLALNPEWYNMGQLRGERYDHDRTAQLDLCGTSGLAPFYLTLKRGLDVLANHAHADPARLAVTGLSGGGWQTIFLAALDPRIAAANPVAGYGSLRTGVRVNDLGDAEQTPCDFAAVADYHHLTALMAPRPLLLTYNARDDCCFRADHTLPPLLESAWPFYRLLGKPDNLRSHINYKPGTHNFQQENREALYRLLGDHFFAGDRQYSAKEIPSEKEVKTAKELTVELSERNEDFHTLALARSKDLPRRPDLPKQRVDVPNWRRQLTERLRERAVIRSYQARAERVGGREVGGLYITEWQMRVGDAWTVPVVELARGKPRKVAILLADGGRSTATAEAERLLDEGYRVLATDLLFCGECRASASPKPQQYVLALLLSSLGDRPLGIQAGQLLALANWAETQFGRPPQVVAVGRRTCLCALVAASVAENITGVELHDPLGSLKELIERNGTYREDAELFCFGLLELLDVKQLAALVAPRPVVVRRASARARAELAGLKAWYALLGAGVDPLAEVSVPKKDGKTSDSRR
jgi:dienelactone hydrolase